MGGGLAGAYILGIDFEYAVLLVSAIFILYVLMGGMLSVTWTDFIQGILLFVFMVGLSITAIVHYGGLAPLMSSAVSAEPHFLDLPMPFRVLERLSLPLGQTFRVL